MLSSSRHSYDIDPEQFWTLRKYLDSEIVELRALLMKGESVTPAFEKLEDITAFLRFHFAIEERILDELEERNLRHHAEAHRQFLKELSDLTKATAESPTCLTPGICDRIDAWLRSHYVKYDTTLETMVALVHDPHRPVAEDIADYLTRVACIA